MTRLIIVGTCQHAPFAKEHDGRMLSTAVTTGRQTITRWSMKWKGPALTGPCHRAWCEGVLFLGLLGLLCLLCHVSLLFPEIGKSGICLEPITGT